LPPHLDAARIALLAAAAFLAGGINAVAGGGSLISFPALLLVGYPALTANVTNTVALVTGYLGGTVGYRRELRGQEQRMVRLGLLSVAGAVLGAFLLLRAPASVFQRLVPSLILGACALLLAQPRIARRVASRAAAREAEAAAAGVQPRRLGWGEIPVALIAAQFVAAVYGAYFGGGLGVITLAVLGIFVHDSLQRINALKGVLSLVINLVAVLYFIAFGSVAWVAVAVMAPISYAGGLLGVKVARRLNDRVLRVVVVCYGVAVGVRLLF
jgi:uncharacterized membrane protein YfcA